MIRNWAAILPGRRMGMADEVSQVILMLLTNKGLTGEVVHVDGGWSLRVTLLDRSRRRLLDIHIPIRVRRIVL